MDAASPTRMNLLARRSQLRLALRGVDLLQKKRDALVKEFFSLVHEALDARRGLNAVGRDAYMSLFLAKAFDGPQEVTVHALSVPIISDVKAELENVWGIRIPRLLVEWPRGITASPSGVGGQTIAAQAAFRKLAQALLRVANTELRLRRIGEEIKKTARRVNALEQMVIPGIRNQIHYIQQVLDQQEQDDIFRLKRIKNRVIARSSQNR